MHHLFRVTTKAVIFNNDFTKVLLLHKEQNGQYGLPGGHVDEGESLESAMRRELFEECGVHATTLQKRDFFMLSNGKIVLAYYGIIESNDIHSQQNNSEGTPKWIDRHTFDTIDIDLQYRQLVEIEWQKTPILT